MAYAKEETIAKIEEITKENANIWYREIPNAWSGTVKGDNEMPYTEVWAKYIIKKGKYEQLKNIKYIDRENSLPERDLTVNPKSNQEEKNIARNIKCIKELGENIYIEYPLAKVEKDSVGEIDFICYDKEKNVLNLIELKRPNNKENLLRAILEICTYSKQVNLELLKEGNLDLKENYTAKPVIMLFSHTDDGEQATIANQAHWLKENTRKYTYVKKLLKELNIDIYVFKTPEGYKYEADGAYLKENFKNLELDFNVIAEDL